MEGRRLEPRSSRWVLTQLQRAGIEPRRAWGQHFLHDRQLLLRQVAYAELDGTQTVLEIGAGIGNLTALLAERSRELIVLEKDRRFAPLLEALERRFTHLRVVWADALTAPLPAVDTVVANLPYGPALPLTFRLLEQRFGRAVLLYQMRLARRLAAGVGEPHYGRLSVAVGRLATVELLERVAPAAFYPEPAVESCLVLLRRTRPRFSVPDEAFFRQVLEGLFRRRTVSLAAALGSLAAGGERPGRTGVMVEPGLLDKVVYRLTPRELGRVSWALWRSAQGPARGG